MVDVVFEGAEEQKRTNACAIARHARNLGKLGVSACPMLHRGREQGGCYTKQKAQQPDAV